MVDIQREFVLQQFLGRPFRSEVADDWILTGGSAIRIRTQEARPTKDADLATHGDLADLTAALTRALHPQPGEPGEFVFTVTSTNTVGSYTGSLEYRLGGRRFGNAAIDITTYRPLPDDPELLTPVPVVDVAELAALPAARLIPVEWHLADKVTAMYERHGASATPSTRPHDLGDIVILSRGVTVDARRLRDAVRHQAGRRQIRIPLPLTLPNPTWPTTYPIRVAHSGLPPALHAVDVALAAANQFLTPALSTTHDARWHPTHGWQPTPPGDRSVT